MATTNGINYLKEVIKRVIAPSTSTSTTSSGGSSYGGRTDVSGGSSYDGRTNGVSGGSDYGGRTSSTYNFSNVEDAQTQWHTLDDAGKTAAHDYVVNAKSGSGEVYDSKTGTWSKPTSSGSTTGIPTIGIPTTGVPTGGAGTRGSQTTIQLPDGSTVAGYINNGVTTLADGSRPTIGSIVKTAGGYYKMTENGGVKIDAPGQTPTTQFPEPTEKELQFQAMQRFLEEQKVSFFEQQKAMLEANRQQQVMELEKAYNDAVYQGQMSQQEAGAAFNQQKEAINQQAYVESQRTNLTAQSRGIQNSQQLMGLQQGDVARTNELNNSNASERDTRIADIKSRLANIAMQKNLDIAGANNAYNTGLMKASADANLAYSQNMFGLMQDDYAANRDHGFDMETIEQESAMRVREMTVQHGFDKEKIALDFKNDIMLLGEKFKYDSALQRQEAQAALSRIAYQASASAKQVVDTYERDKARALAEVKPGTDEYKIAMGRLEQQKIADLTALHTKATYEAQAIGSLSVYSEERIPEPSNNYQIFGGLNTKAYDKQQERLNTAEDFVQNPWKYFNIKNPYDN